MRPGEHDPGVTGLLVDTIRVDDLTFAEAVTAIVAAGLDGSGGYMATPNVDHIVRARRDPQFRQVVMGARLRVPDGMGIIYGSRIAGRPLRGTVTGRLLPEAVARAGEADRLPLALLGGRPGAARAAAERLRLAGGHVVAALEPSMGFVPGSEEDDALVATLKQSRARVVFVGLGSPKQETWMARHVADLPSSLLVAIGQGIDVLGGVVPGAPAWMTRLGIEWTYRLVHEPRRLARRYLRDDPRFFLWMLRSRLSR